ncbi:MAG: Glutamate-tRNA ligase [Candidatus Shapirobacteria bacterium GW2011_GWE1_38_10]|uniref:Glutamate--tRNA ligase n=1 Tax=Candidatus Shapirobacteria bacterium GW2011_GWE1_38_10 TaxID=1618488 RepID=A0A0G0L8Y0_9BACT|nr:MAG: Glutamate-tRNA ligase [Candidatus Shapirobacteria bacterium GW2011_GWF2_37_20]KKQ49086.1 MAG: Glutamate-tRNA ligase [Candidatus Shapirobacteria bacterium GW2011_GWE1_38_10]HBP51662.1 glutamate--tRNA ligase [Candidatus Shapirobacteria bacterium]
MSDTNIVRTRMAPSPTGELHIGGLRTLLYDYALARQNHGQFILRLEDTDQKRHVEGAESRIFQVIKDYGLSWDEGPDIGGPYGPYVQTKRLNIYQKYIKELLDQDLAYYCFCSEQRLTEMREVQKAAHKVPKYDRHCLKLSSKEIKQKIENGEKYVIRLKMPDNENIVFKDLIRGEIKFNTNELDDQVLIKSDGIPTYHFAVVVDDHLMKITHIFRGEEWISSTPKQILLYKYFKWEVPNFAHLTVLLDPSGHGKMSKRHGSTHARAFLDDGYLPEAMLNFLMLLGWNPGTDKELFTLDEFIKEFNLEHLHKKSPIFDRKKLDYFNGLYIRQKSDEELFPYFKKFLPQASDEQIKILIPVLKERLIKFSDLSEQVKFLFEDVDYDKDLLLKKGTSSELAAEMLNKTKELLSDFTNLSSRILNLISENSWNTGEFFMVFRVAICGSSFTPPLVECLPALGQEGTIRKLDLALTKLK